MALPTDLEQATAKALRQHRKAQSLEAVWITLGLVALALLVVAVGTKLQLNKTAHLRQDEHHTAQRHIEQMRAIEAQAVQDASANTTP